MALASVGRFRGRVLGKRSQNLLSAVRSEREPLGA